MEILDFSLAIRVYLRSISRIISVMRTLVLMTLTASLLCASAVGQAKPYPAPPISSAKGQPAPDFTLTDQDGRKFTLSQQSGHWVLLFFYRGYW